MNPAPHPLTFSAAACKVFSYKVFFSPLSKKQAAGPPWVSRLFCFYRCVSRYYSVGADAHIGPLRRPLVALRRVRCPHPACPLSSAFPVMCHCHTSDRCHWCGNPSPCITPPVAPFLSAAKEREKRTPPKPGAVKSALAFAYSLRLIPRRALRLCWPGGTGETSASAVRGDVGIAPYGFLSVTGA